jgi:hypothetical protein
MESITNGNNQGIAVGNDVISKIKKAGIMPFEHN